MICCMEFTDETLTLVQRSAKMRDFVLIFYSSQDMNVIDEYGGFSVSLLEL
jgi:hypothetical protein